MLGLGFFGGGRKRKIAELHARAAVLRRWIETCEQALAICATEEDEAQGYRAARNVRRSLLQADLATHRVELDGVVAQIAALTPSPEDDTRRGPRLARRGRLVAGAVAGVLLLLAAALPIELGLIPTLIATEEVIEVDPRALGSAVHPAVEVRATRWPAPIPL